jgi:AraC-like DNA-binding protein
VHDASPFFYSEEPPPPDLADHVLAFWNFRVRSTPDERFLHHVWPDGCVSLIFSFEPGADDGATVVGPGLSARRVPVCAGACYRGARFWPDAACAILRRDPVTLRDGRVDATEVFEETAIATTLRELRRIEEDVRAAEVLSRLLAPVVRRASTLDLRVRTAVSRLIEGKGEVPLPSLAAASGLSTRQLQRRFRRATGLSPKEFARIRRVRSASAAILAGERNWASLAANLGFCDQAHLTKEFAAITGFTPSKFEARIDLIGHGRVSP